MEENKKKSNKIFIAIIAFLLVIDVVVGYLLYSENKQKQQKIEEVTKLTSDYQDLNGQFETAKAELETLKGKNAELDSIVNARQAKIEEYQAKLADAQKKGNLNAAEITKYKGLISSLQEENATLQQRVTELTSKNQDLTAKNLELDKSLVAEKATTADLTAKNDDLFQKGSLFTLQNVKLDGDKRKKSGKEIEKHNVKSVEYLDLHFTITENRVLEAGTPVTFYVRFISPSGVVLTSSESGTVPLKDGSSLAYSKKADTEWTGRARDFSVEWAQRPTEKGTYKAEVYQNGILIGTSSVTLK